MLDVCLLGTAGMMPLPYRWLTSLMLRYNGSSLLIDCGEGTQIAIKEGEITNVAVTRKMRKKGCGRELLLRMQQWADEHGIDRIILEVRSGNEPAIHLYRTCGFEKIGVRKNFYQFPREDADIMEWKRLC